MTNTETSSALSPHHAQRSSRVRTIGFAGVMTWLSAALLFSGCSKESEEENRAKLDELVETVAAKGAYSQVCAACHGANGEGNEELKSPSIAGMPKWYIEEQFRKFREGQRGAHMNDVPGQQMRAIAMTLSEEQINEAAKTVSEFPVILTEKPPEEANIERGRLLFANVCMECHRYNGKGEVVFHSAQLISLNRTYLRRQLQNFHSGKRGSDPSDISGQKMVDVTSRLDDEDIEILVDYIGALAHGDDPRPARER